MSEENSWVNQAEAEAKRVASGHDHIEGGTSGEGLSLAVLPIDEANMNAIKSHIDDLAVDSDHVTKSSKELQARVRG